MTFLRGLLAGRSHLAFLAGLAAAFAVARGVDRQVASAAAPSFDAAAGPAAALPLRPVGGPLGPGERALAQAAWEYLERNVDPGTGLVASVKGHPVTTLWEIGAQLMAVLAASDLGLVSDAGASRRLSRALVSLEALPLCEGVLPNKAYDVRTLEMVVYDGRPAPDGVGWSALDVARVLVPLSIIPWRHPELAPLVRRATARWNLRELEAGGVLRGTTRRQDGVLEARQEGRFGYEQLAARALAGWGVPVGPLQDPRAHLAFTTVEGRPVPHDDRRPRDHGGVHAALVSEPWILAGLEDGYDAVTLPIARAVLGAQARRSEATGRLTSASEDALDRPPWFSYSAILNGDERWVAVGPDGVPAPGAFTFSTKAAVAWGVLFAGSYPDALLAAAAERIVPGEGLEAGRYDATGEPNHALSLGTNAVVLEALAYRVRGPLAARATFARLEANR